MATFLQVGLLDNFGVIFVILLVFLIVYGLLGIMNIFKGNNGLNAVIALIVALLFLVSKSATQMVVLMVPWFIVIAIFLFFTLFLARVFGLDEAGVTKLIKDPSVYPFIIIFAALILFLALGNVLGQGLLEKGEGVTPTESSTGTATSPDGGTTGSTSLEPAVTGTTSTTTDSFTTNMLNTLRHPKVLGMLFVFLVGALTLLFLTKPWNPD